MRFWRSNPDEIEGPDKLELDAEMAGALEKLQRNYSRDVRDGIAEATREVRERAKELSNATNGLLFDIAHGRKVDIPGVNEGLRVNYLESKRREDSLLAQNVRMRNQLIAVDVEKMVEAKTSTAGLPFSVYVAGEPVYSSRKFPNMAAGLKIAAKELSDKVLACAKNNEPFSEVVGKRRLSLLPYATGGKNSKTYVVIACVGPADRQKATTLIKKRAGDIGEGIGKTLRGLGDAYFEGGREYATE